MWISSLALVQLIMHLFSLCNDDINIIIHLWLVLYDWSTTLSQFIQIISTRIVLCYTRNCIKFSKLHCILIVSVALAEFPHLNYILGSKIYRDESTFIIPRVSYDCALLMWRWLKSTKYDSGISDIPWYYVI